MSEAFESETRETSRSPDTLTYPQEPIDSPQVSANIHPTILCQQDPELTPGPSEDADAPGSVAQATQVSFLLDDSNVITGSPFADTLTDSSSFAFLTAVSPNSAPFHWYDLLAQDALNNFEKRTFVNHDISWDFDPICLSRRPSAANLLPENSFNIVTGSEPAPDSRTQTYRSRTQIFQRDRGSDPTEAWNLAHTIVLQAEELRYFQHYIQEIAPILDLFDPSKHFGNLVPHMALRNVGLMKALLAVAAQHLSLGILDQVRKEQLPSEADPTYNELRKDHRYVAIQYFYETLKYLAAAMQVPSYTRSSEILATAVMISTYEMFDGSSQEWERHLRGAFWIQRTQDNDGESRGLREAVWWAWVRQDIWAAFREERRTLTIWRPKKALAHLTADELATRVIYLLTKAVSYASKEAMRTQDLTKRIEDGNTLLKALDDWLEILPRAYNPIPFSGEEATVFKPIWVHPPAYAAAIQSYHFARIVILLNMPSIGGVSSYQKRQVTLQEASKIICGLAMAAETTEPASAFVNFQCLFAGTSSKSQPLF